MFLPRKCLNATAGGAEGGAEHSHSSTQVNTTSKKEQQKELGRKTETSKVRAQPTFPSSHPADLEE